MIRIEAIIRPAKVAEVFDALNGAGHPAMTVSAMVYTSRFCTHQRSIREIRFQGANTVRHTDRTVGHTMRRNDYSVW